MVKIYNLLNKLRIFIFIKLLSNEMFDLKFVIKNIIFVGLLVQFKLNYLSLV